MWNLFLLTLLTATPALQDSAAEAREISTRIWHLGDDDTPEWPEAPAKPDGTQVEVTFEGIAFPGEGLLVCTQRHVNNPWHLELNGQRFATLEAVEPLGEHYYTIPAGLIVDGTNRLVLVGDVPTDDITFGALAYFPEGFREHFDLRKVRVSVRGADGEGMPARVTLTDEAGALQRFFFAESPSTAVREGVAYTMDGQLSLEVPPGRYEVFAARGTEWSLAHKSLVVDGPAHEVGLQLRRELDTRGFVAADTHIHTLTHSGHGDSSVEERMVTLAGEGVELAIATDHNHNIDYRPTQEAMGLSRYFTPVVGNEVSTPVGHLNGFPLGSEDEVPAHDGTDIVEIVAGIRAKGALAVILNHPRWPSHEDSPHGDMQLDQETGDWTGNWACPFDAMELINSQTSELEPMLLFRDWFALMNRGERVSAVGSSDSHTVGGVVGQGRTYVRSSTDDPSAIDVEEAALNLANGHSSISMGIFVDARQGAESVLGETLRFPGEDTSSLVDLRIAAPSWVHPTKLTVLANGKPIFTTMLARSATPQPFEELVRVPRDLAWPQHDFYLVAIVEGEGVGGAFWPQINDYTLAATNPMFFDVDGDGVCTNPRALATALLAKSGTEPAAVAGLLEQVDSAVAVQLLRQVRLAYLESAERAAASLADGARAKHPNLVEWLRGLGAKD